MGVRTHSLNWAEQVLDLQFIRVSHLGHSGVSAPLKYPCSIKKSFNFLLLCSKCTKIQRTVFLPKYLLLKFHILFVVSPCFCHAIGYDIASFILKQCRGRLESITSLYLRACKTELQTTNWIYLFSQFHDLTCVTFFCLYQLATSAVNLLNGVEEGRKMILGFITPLLQDKVL